MNHVIVKERRVDLNPRGHRTVKLSGSTTLKDAIAGAGCFYSWCEPEHRPGLGAALKEATEVGLALRTKEEASSFLRTLGAVAWEQEKLSSLRLRIQIRLIDLWYPMKEAS